MGSFHFSSLIRQVNLQICAEFLLTNCSLPHKLTSQLKKLQNLWNLVVLNVHKAGGSNSWIGGPFLSKIQQNKYNGIHWDPSGQK